MLLLKLFQVKRLGVLVIRRPHRQLLQASKRAFVAHSTWHFQNITDQILKLVALFPDRMFCCTSLHIMKGAPARWSAGGDAAALALTMSLGGFTGGEFQWGAPGGWPRRTKTKNAWMLTNLQWGGHWTEEAQLPRGHHQYVIVALSMKEFFYMHPLDPVVAVMALVGVRYWGSFHDYLAYAESLGVDGGVVARPQDTHLALWMVHVETLVGSIQDTVPELAQDPKENQTSNPTAYTVDLHVNPMCIFLYMVRS